MSALQENTMATAAPEKRPPPRARAADWNESDKAYVDRLVNKAFEQMRKAHDDHDKKLFGEKQELLIGILIIADLCKAYRHSRTKNIDGPGGVARQMHLSRNGVYFRLDAVKLNPHDFKEEDAQVGALIKKSSLKRLATKTLES
jgi:hypothetical protein